MAAVRLKFCIQKVERLPFEKRELFLRAIFGVRDSVCLVVKHKEVSDFSIAVESLHIGIADYFSEEFVFISYVARELSWNRWMEEEENDGKNRLQLPCVTTPWEVKHILRMTLVESIATLRP